MLSDKAAEAAVAGQLKHRHPKKGQELLRVLITRDKAIESATTDLSFWPNWKAKSHCALKLSRFLGPSAVTALEMKLYPQETYTLFAREQRCCCLLHLGLLKVSCLGHRFRLRRMHLPPRLYRAQDGGIVKAFNPSGSSRICAQRQTNYRSQMCSCLLNPLARPSNRTSAYFNRANTTSE